MEILIEQFEKSTIQVCQLKWKHSWIFLISAPKGIITCGSFDLIALNDFGTPAAKIFPKEGQEAYTIDDFINRKITHVNKLASEIGMKPGLTIKEAVEILS